MSFRATELVESKKKIVPLSIITTCETEGLKRGPVKLENKHQNRCSVLIPNKKRFPSKVLKELKSALNFVFGDITEHEDNNVLWLIINYENYAYVENIVQETNDNYAKDLLIQLRDENKLSLPINKHVEMFILKNQ